MMFLTSFLRRLARPDVPFFALPWLMILLAAGTIAQRDMGLYAAQKTFFSSWIFWLGPVPLPGGYATIALIGAALAAKFVMDSRWTRRDAGIVLAHGGALLLLCGGLVTAVTAREGFMTIPEQAQAAQAEDYHDKALTVTAADGRVAAHVPHTHLKPGKEIAAGPLTVAVLEYCYNCAPAERTETMRDGLAFTGPAAKVRMTEIPRDMAEEANHSAVTVAVRGSDTAQDGIYLMTDIMPHQPQIGDYSVRFGRRPLPLPFTVRLDDVRRELYPGTDTARGYESHVHVHDGGTPWPAVIRMNEPLRYKGYTLYQSSYIRDEAGTEITVLSVVKNSGRLFPYIASIVIAAGLIFHAAMTLAGRRKSP